VEKRKMGTFLPPERFLIGNWPLENIKNPRAFLYEKKKLRPKSFFKKYIKRHLNKIKRIRAISDSEISYFRSWLGLKELGALAN
jgi:dolichyl-phosphate-mannose--protein O-mannosyl transferase